MENVSKKKTKKEQSIELYNVGEKNPQAIAEKIGTKVGTVYVYLREARIEGKIEKKKTKKEQVIELYNEGELNSQSIAEKLKIKVVTVNSYLSNARKEGKIEREPKSKTKKEQVIELYNEGETNSQAIAEKLKIKVITVNIYLSNARKEGKIEKLKTKKEQIIKLYNEGETNSQAIAEKVGIKLGTVNNYLSEAQKEGKIERLTKNTNKTKTKKEQVTELYNAGETNPQKIAEKVGIKLGTVNNYLREEREEGKIEKPKTKKEQVIELYNEGEKSPESIANIIGCTVKAVNVYLSRARKEGKIKKQPSKKEQILEMYNSGERSAKAIATKLGINIETVNNCLYLARKEEKNKHQREEKKSLNQEERKVVAMPQIKKEQEKTFIPKVDNPIDEKLKHKIIVLLETKYPREIAKELNIQSKKVYDVIDGLDKELIKKLKIKKVKNNPLYPKIVNLRKSKNLNMEKALYVLVKTNLSLKDTINLARIYYILGNEKVPERLLNEVIFDETASSKIIDTAKEEKEKMLLEIKSVKIRHDYKKGKNMDNTSISFDDLCRKYNVRTSFLIDLIGREDQERSI